MLGGMLLVMPLDAASAQSPAASRVSSPGPIMSAGSGASPGACPAMVTAQLPLRDTSARLVARFGDPDASLADPAPSAGDRYQAGDDWQVPAATDGTPAGIPVYPIGEGTVLALGPTDDGVADGIMVVGHTGSLSIPGSPPEAPYTYPAETDASVISVYEGLVPSPDLTVGACVDTDTVLGTTGVACQEVASPASSCVPARPLLHLELRLATTVDPTMRSYDWTRVGQPEDSVDGMFLDPQRMVDDGLRDPMAFIGSLAPPSSPAPGATVVPASWPSPPPSPGTGSAHRPQAPRNVAFKVHESPWTGNTQPDYRLKVTWDTPVQPGTTIEVYGVMRCPRKPVMGGRYCLTPTTPLPKSILELQATAPASNGSVSWLAQGWGEIGGPIGLDKAGKDVWAIVVRAVNAAGASRFVIARNGNGWTCSDCVY